MRNACVEDQRKKIGKASWLCKLEWRQQGWNISGSREGGRTVGTINQPPRVPLDSKRARKLENEVKNRLIGGGFSSP